MSNTPKKSWFQFLGNSTSQQPSVSNGQTSPGASNHSDIDITYVTSRLIVMTTPRENTAGVSITESTRDLLDKKHGNSYMVYSLDDSPSQIELFHDRVIGYPLSNGNATPSLIVLLCFCQKVTSYLLESPSNVAVLHCIDGRNELALGACSLLAYHKIFPQVDQIILYYEQHRCAHPILTMSQKRYIQYLCDLSFDAIERPHFNEVILKSINLSPIPFVDQKKNGCRPFIDVYDDEEKKIFSTYQEASKLRVYSATDNCCLIPVNIPFNGDLTIHVTHATIGHSRQTHEGGIRICELTVNSNFITPNRSELCYSRDQLDQIDHNEKSPTLFNVTLHVENLQKSTNSKQDSFLKQLDNTLKRPLVLFHDENELQQKVNQYEKKVKKQNGEPNGNTDAPSSPSPAKVYFRTASKDDSMSPISSTASSPRNSQRYSGSFSFSSNSPISFINPRHNPFKQQMEMNSSIRAPPLVEEKQTNENLDVEVLVDFENNSKLSFERSISSDAQSQSLNSSYKSQKDLLSDDDTDFNKPTLANNSLKPTLSSQLSTTFPHTSQNPKNLTPQPPPPSKSPNYHVDIQAKNGSPSLQRPPNPSSTKSTSKNTGQYNIKNDKSLFEDLNPINDIPKPKSEPPRPSKLGEIRRNALVKDIDPIVLRVRDWTEGKKRNLRALLCSLSTVTWPECTWPGCQMNELISYDQVKKVYRKAVLHIHPDKLRGDPNENLAKLIFVELNEAWSQFEAEANAK